MRIWPFNRNRNIQQNDPLLPTEVKDYYQAETRDRRGAAWVLGLTTVIVTVLLAFGLFFGGRFVYRKLTDKNDNVATTNQTPTNSNPAPSTNNDDKNDNSDDKNNEDNSDNNADSSIDDSEDDEDRVATNLPSDGNSQKADLPDTGPGSVVAIFAATSTIAATGHYLFNKRRS